MGFSTETMVVQVMRTFTKCKTLLASSARSFLEARRQRLEHERQFYRNLKAYCRANNLSPICEDDWKTAAFDKTDDDNSMIHSKGNVS